MALSDIQPAAAGSNTLALWPMGETAASTVWDNSEGNSDWDATPASGSEPAVSTDVPNANFSRSRVFDHNDYASVATPAEFGTGAFSIEFLFKIADNANADTEGVISTYGTSTANRRFFIQRGRTGGYDDIIFGVISGNASYTTPNAANVSRGVWHYGVCVFVPSTGLYVYIDGALYSQKTSGVPAAMDGDSTTFTFGRYNPTWGGANAFDGLLTDVHVVDGALSSTDISDRWDGIGGGGSSTDQEVSTSVSASISLTIETSQANQPQIQGTATTTSGTRSTSHSINLPTSIANGELLLMILTAAGTADGDSPVELASITTPTGWTQLFNDPYDGSLKVRHAAYYRTADGTEGSTVSVTTSGARVAGIVHRINNAQTTPEAGTSVAGNGTSVNPPSLTPSWGIDKNLWIPTFGSRAARSVTGTPTDYTSQTAVASGSVSSSLHCRANSITRGHYATSEDPGAWTLDVAVDYVTNTIAIQPTEASVTSQAVTATVGASPSIALQKSFLRTISDAVSASVSVAKNAALTRALTTAVSGAASLLTGSISFKEIAATVSATTTMLRGSIQSVALNATATAATAIIRGSGYARDLFATVTGTPVIEQVKSLGQVLTATVSSTVTITKNFWFSVTMAVTATAAASIPTAEKAIGRILSVTAKAWTKMQESFWKEKYKHQDDDYHVKY